VRSPPKYQLQRQRRDFSLFPSINAIRDNAAIFDYSHPLTRFATTITRDVILAAQVFRWNWNRKEGWIKRRGQRRTKGTSGKAAERIAVCLPAVPRFRNPD